MAETTSGGSIHALRLLLRLFGTSSLFALIFVAAPHSWMRAIHAWADLGEMPEAPVVWYLARSTSAFYALVGGLFWVTSFDLRRHRIVVWYLGATVTTLGGVLLVVDWWEGMPLAWTLWEGPVAIGFGGLMLFLIRAVPR